MTYFNTNNETGETLNISRRKAKSQEDIVLKFFKDNPQQLGWTAEEVHRLAFGEFCGCRIPLTSVRRAITVLCNGSDTIKGGQLVKTDRMQKGMYGKSIHLYKLA
jgi:hypothetical protein